MDGMGVGLGEPRKRVTEHLPYVLPCKSVDEDEKTPVTSAQHRVDRAGRVVPAWSSVPGTGTSGAGQAGCGEVWELLVSEAL